MIRSFVFFSPSASGEPLTGRSKGHPSAAPQVTGWQPVSIFLARIIEHNKTRTHWGYNMDIKVKNLAQKKDYELYLHHLNLYWFRNSSGCHVGDIPWHVQSFLRASSARFKHILEQTHPSTVLFIDFSLASLPSIGYAARKVACGTPQQYQNTSLEHEIHTILKLKKNFLLAQCSMVQCQNNVTFQWVIALVSRIAGFWSKSWRSWSWISDMGSLPDLCLCKCIYIYNMII